MTPRTFLLQLLAMLTGGRLLAQSEVNATNQVRNLPAIPSLAAALALLQTDTFVGIGAVTTFTTTRVPASPASLLVFRNGLYQIKGTDFALTSPATGPWTVTIANAQAGDNVALLYLA